MKEIVRVNCVRHLYADRTEVSICGMEFRMTAGESVVILGPNGSGKTTLLGHIMGLLKPLEGEVRVFGVNPQSAFKEVRRRMGVVFQNVEEQIIGPTVWDDIAFSPVNHGLPIQQVRHMVEEIMTDIGISHLKDRIPHYLSGGEKKKVALAGALVMRPELLIMDEPFNGVDCRSKQEIIELLRLVREKYGTALVLTTHDVNIVPQLAQTVYVLSCGRFIFRGSPEDAFNRPEILREANIDPPVLMQLFAELQSRGLPVETPKNVTEATEQLCKIFNCIMRPTVNG